MSDLCDPGECWKPQLEAERDALRAALQRYGKHNENCRHIACFGVCDCGFIEALRGTERTADQPTAAPPMEAVAVCECCGNEFHSGLAEWCPQCKKMAARLTWLLKHRATTQTSERRINPPLLKPVTSEWETTKNDHEVTCHSRVIGGVLCRWWGDDPVPPGVETIDRAALQQFVAPEQKELDPEAKATLYANKRDLYRK